ARAMGALERVAALAPAPATLDALARLYLVCREPATAAGWLEQRLAATSDGAERAAVALRLAEAYVAAGQRHRAVATAERALAECLRAAGRPAEARAALQPLLEAVGRRRSCERAALHQQIALAARAEGDLRLALEHLDQAASMVLDDMGAQLSLAEVAEEAGE